MSLINRLICEAKLGADVLRIKPNEVRKIAEHCKGCILQDLTIEELSDVITLGQLKLLDVPVKVLGHRT